MQITVPKIICLDSAFNDGNHSFLHKLGTEEKIEIFTEVSPCITSIKSHSPDQPIILIVSGSYAVKAVPEIYDLSNILLVFVFCASMESYRDWAMDYCDKLLMFDHEDDLLERLWRQFEEYSRSKAKEYEEQADVYKQRSKQLNQSCG